VWDSIAPLRYLQATTRPIGVDLVRLAVRVGRHDHAVVVTEELERSARRGPTPTTEAMALQSRGLLGGDPELLIEAVTVHRRGPRPSLLAVACEDAGTICGRRGRLGEARRLLDEAVAGYQRLGAEWDVVRVRTEQRRLKFPLAAPVRRRPTFGWDSLTTTELRVLALVAAGLTNRQAAERLFVSRRTVATHVEHLLQKLGHTNRVALAADAVRHGITDPTSTTRPTTPAATPATRRTDAPPRQPQQPTRPADRTRPPGS
jgi:DNA-binding CsgD family transcriptional regulator